MTDLKSLIDPQSQWDLVCAMAINDRGQICGYGTMGGYSLRAFLLNPTIFRTDLNADGQTDSLDLREFAVLQSSQDARADWNLDHVLDERDWLAFIADAIDQQKIRR